MTGYVTFEVGNTWTSVTNADPFILHILGKEARYPTEQALAFQGGFRSPDDPGGSGWDGWIRLLRKPKTMYPYFPSGLVPNLSRIARKFKYEPIINDLRKKPEEQFPELIDISLRGYQEEAVRKGVVLGRGVFSMVPRSGKTRCLCELHRRLAVPTLWIAPTDRIVRQTVKVIEGFFGKHYVHHLVGSAGEQKAAKKHMVVCTYATAAKLSQEFYDTRQMLAVDEVHHSSSHTIIKEIVPMCDHIYYRFGMTGTFFRSGTDAMAMHGFLSEVIHRVTSGDLLKLGYLVPTNVVFLPVPKNPMLRGAGQKFSGGFGEKGIHEHQVRNAMVAHSAVTLHNFGRKVLILVGTKRQGRSIQKMVSAFLPEPPRGARFKTAEFLSTDRDRNTQTEIIDSYLAEQEVKVLLGTSMLGEGVDLPQTDALVYARGEKASVSITQNAYRVCTAVPGKKDAIIVDFADRHHKKLLEHSEGRLRVYHKDPIFSPTILQDANQFLPYLEHFPVQDSHQFR